MFTAYEANRSKCTQVYHVALELELEFGIGLWLANPKSNPRI